MSTNTHTLIPLQADLPVNAGQQNVSSGLLWSWYFWLPSVDQFGSRESNRLNIVCSRCGRNWKMFAFSHSVVFPPFVSLHCDLNANSAAGSTRPLGPRGAHCTWHCHYSLTHLWATRMISSSIYQWYQYDWPQFWYLMIRFFKFIFMWKLVVFKLWDLRLVEMMEASNWNTYLRLLCQFSVYISFWSTDHLLQVFLKKHLDCKIKW